MQCHLNIGSNTGDSLAIIREAISLIDIRIAIPGTMQVSDPVISEPWGYSSAALFTNVGIQFTASCTPAQLLDRIRDIEHDLGATPHRNPDGTYRDRNLDIDIIHLGDLTVDTPQLTVPHPRMHLRRFVLLPLAQLDPEWRHPTLHLTPAELIALLHTSASDTTNN